MDIASLINGLGIGGFAASVLTIIINYRLENKKTYSNRTFDEKRSAYTAYLEAIAKSQTMNQEEGLWVRTSAIERIKICGSQKVVELLEIVSSTPPNQPRENIDRLIKAMRQDLFPKENR